MLAALAFCPPLHSQQPRTDVSQPSDLAAENLSRVAASPAQLEEVLRKEPGLMVELKRWVAKEATEHGRILEDADVTDQGISDRLALDLTFRAVATRLVQRYGYLLPKLNPDSPFAREEELRLKERTRQLARAEAEEEDLPGRRPYRKDSGRTDACDSQRDTTCAQLAEPVQGRRRRPGQAFPRPSDAGSPAPEDETIPRRSPGNPLDVPETPSRQLIPTAVEAEAGPEPRAIQTTKELMVGARAEETHGARSAAWEGTRESSLVMREENASQGTRPKFGRRNIREEESGPPTVVRRANPYADIPSLYDMYVQASARQPALERFGLDVFRNGTRDSESLPMDLPADPDYVVGPGDGLSLDLWGGVVQRFYRVVDREGRISLPEVGPVLVSGRTMGEVQQAVQKILRTQFRDVSADVSLSRLRTIRVYIVGEVEQPGAYDISSLSTPLNALLAAGGVTARGTLRALKHLRGKQLVQEVDAYDLLLRGVRADLKRLETGDTLLVPPMGPQVTVEGMVRRPAVYELRGETTLAEVLQLAGGILPTAALRHIEVQRLEAHQKRTMLSLDIPDTKDLESVQRQLELFAIQNEDEVHIFPIAPYNQGVVYLQGHVLRPGRYSFQPGMKLTHLISSYADFLPEPAAKYAEIVRLNPPDYRPSVESFDPTAALANPASAPQLQPLDTVRIFGRYDFEDPPAVWVGGEVRRPGLYRTSGETHLRDAIYLAGGLAPDALLDTAQLVRTMPDSSLKILSVNLAQALAGHPVDNLLLQPRDRLVVHRNPAKVDPPSVLVKGEVAKPGRYPLSTNLRVADLIRLAGGLKRSAYTETADLSRYVVRGTPEQFGEHRDINIAAALAGNLDHDLPLRDGDVLTLRQVPGWNDIGASIAVQGEVEHPGVYGIRPGERISSVLRRAGGFRATAYPRAAVLERLEVRQLQEKNKQELMQRVEQDAALVKVSFTEGAREQAELQQAALQQRQRVLEGLRQMRVTGRLVIDLSGSLAELENGPGDIELRAGDKLVVPKRPGFVVVTGQVYNSNAINFAPRKTAGWYLQRAGGPTRLADRKAIFIIRANGGVITENREGWWAGNILSARIEPGDTIFVPEKAIGDSSFWKSLLGVAQIAQSASVAALVATR